MIKSQKVGDGNVKGRGGEQKEEALLREAKCIKEKNKLVNSLRNMGYES